MSYTELHGHPVRVNGCSIEVIDRRLRRVTVQQVHWSDSQEDDVRPSDSCECSVVSMGSRSHTIESPLLRINLLKKASFESCDPSIFSVIFGDTVRIQSAWRHVDMCAEGFFFEMESNG